MRMVIWFFGLILVQSIFTMAPSALAAPDGQIRAANLENMADADAFAKNLILDHQAEARANPETAKDPIVIMHVGNDLPSQLRWVMAHLDKARVPFIVDLVEKHELESALTKARDKAPSHTALLAYDDSKTAQRAREGIHSAWQKSKLLLKRAFGMPHGFTLWVKMNRTKKQKLGEAITSGVQSGIAGFSLGFSLYLAQQAGKQLTVPAPTALLVSWVFVNMYWARQLAEWQNQGRAVTEPQPGQFKVRKGNAFFYLTGFLRSVLTNVLIVGGAYGPEKLLTADHWETNIKNSVVNLFARSWVDQWINKHQATTLPDGTVVVEAGQWSPKKTIVINTVWNVAYGMLKNLHLLNLGEVVGWTYAVMGVVGVGKLMFDERHTIKRKLAGLARVIRGETALRCETLFIRKSRLGEPR